MRSSLLKIMIVLAFLPASTSGSDDPERIPRDELSNRPFVIDSLKVTIKRFWPGSLLSRGYVEVIAENTSDLATTFNPRRLTFVGKDGRQVNIRGRRQRGPRHPDDRAIDIAEPREIAPRAYVKELYELDGRVHLPAGLFYEGKELARVIK
jgi:hypothetical protein